MVNGEVSEQFRSNGELESDTFILFQIPQRVHGTEPHAAKWADAENLTLSLYSSLFHSTKTFTLKPDALTQSPRLRTPCATEFQPRTIHDPEYPSPK